MNKPSLPLPVYLLGLSIFCMTTSEFMVSGLMPSLAGAFQVSVSDIGKLIAIYAFGMVVGGPVMTLALRKLPHKHALLVLLAIFLLAQIIASTATDYLSLFAARLINGISAGAVFGAATSICIDLVEEHQRGHAMSIVLGGLMLSSVFGLPMATLLDQWLGWRMTFAFVALMIAVCWLALFTLVPKHAPAHAGHLLPEIKALASLRLWAAYLTSALIIGSTMAAFSYFSPIFTGPGAFSANTVPLLFAVYGGATVIGNVITGRLADRYTIPVLISGLCVLAIAMSGFALFAESKILTVFAIVLIGLCGLPMNPAMVTRVMRVTPNTTLINTLHASVINIGLMLGSWGGGAAIEAGYGLRAPLWLGAALAITGLISLWPRSLRQTTMAPTVVSVG